MGLCPYFTWIKYLHVEAVVQMNFGLPSNKNGGMKWPKATLTQQLSIVESAEIKPKQKKTDKEKTWRRWQIESDIQMKHFLETHNKAKQAGRANAPLFAALCKWNLDT